MSEVQIRLEHLDAMRVVSIRVISATPERDASEKLQAWVKSHGLTLSSQHRIFGFNNPPPIPGKRNYGYEFWMEVGPDVQPDGDIDMKEFPGGLYAVTTCRLHRDPAGSIGEVWQKLWRWTQTSPYRWRNTHELERPLNPLASSADLILDLYLPVEPRPPALAAPAPPAPPP